MSNPPREVIVEFVPRGNAVKVSAIDTETGTEVSIVGDPNAGRDQLSQLAVQKLTYVMGKQEK